MTEDLYRRCLLHVESIKFITTDLETTIKLAMQLNESLDMPATTDDAIAKIQRHLAEVQAHLAEAQKGVTKSQVRINRLAQLFHCEVEFAEAEKAI